MPLGIGNNLIRNGGGLDPDKLALDLQFAADKTLTARKGPTPTFTRASSGTFVGSNGLVQTAGNNVARFDHNPVTLASRGLLIEESRTNLFVRSDNFTSTGWLTSNATVSSDVTTSPDGLTTADKLITDSGITLGRVSQTFTLTGSHSMSVFAKASGWNWVFIAPLGAAGGVWFDLLNGSVGTQSSGFVGSISSFGNGWYRCIVSFTGTSTSLTARIVSTNANGVQSTGDGTSGIFIWGAQLEAGSFATSYIPTTTSSVVRSADVCSIFGTDFTGIWNYDEGTIYAAFDQAPSNAFSAILTAARFDDTGKVQIGRATSSQIYLSIKNNANAETFLYNPTSSIAAGLNKSALAYKVNDSIGTVNNLSSPLDTVVALGTPDRLLIANDSVGSGRRHNGTINAVRVYKKRLPLSKLQTLTAP